MTELWVCGWPIETNPRGPGRCCEARFETKAERQLHWEETGHQSTRAWVRKQEIRRAKAEIAGSRR